MNAASTPAHGLFVRRSCGNDVIAVDVRHSLWQKIKNEAPMQAICNTFGNFTVKGVFINYIFVIS